jgi:dTDP-4-dehydrorhamnose reductase
MRLLVLGGSGMLGHKLVEVASRSVETFVTVREGSGDRVVSGVDATDFDTVAAAIESVQPHAVVNCIGIVKQSPAAKDAAACLTINALFPHKLYRLCDKKGIRLVHVSTDCVFDGRRGGYREFDLTNATDLYGRTKALGELEDALTIRTSIIGRELATKNGLVEWFLSRAGGTVQGYTHAKFNGLTTAELSRVILSVLNDYPDLRGIIHVTSESIDKFSLLHLLNDSFGTSTKIVPDDRVWVDRTLDGELFRSQTGYTAPTWQEMIEELAADTTLVKERMHA